MLFHELVAKSVAQGRDRRYPESLERAASLASDLGAGVLEFGREGRIVVHPSRDRLAHCPGPFGGLGDGRTARQ
jgi:hypothetical protein